MKLIKLWRTFKEGFKNFYRNGWLTIATVSVLSLSLYVIGATIMIGITAHLALQNIQQTINISAYFNTNVEESRIMEVKGELEKYAEVRAVEYVSREQALDYLLSIEDVNTTINEALVEIGENPLLASLVVTANQPDQYETIARIFSESNLKDLVHSVNYEQNRDNIEDLNKVIGVVQKSGIILGSIFIFISILITFNTIRITLYSHKQEFEIMRLVGASNLYIKMPSVFEGIFYGISAAFFVMALLFTTARVISPITRGAIMQGDLISLYLSYFWLIFGSLFLSGILLGTLSSFIAIRRYLKI